MSLLRWGIEVGGVFVVGGGAVMGGLLLSLRPGEVPSKKPNEEKSMGEDG